MLCLEQYVLLILYVLNLLFLQKEIFIDSFHCIHSIHLTIVYQEYFSKRTLVNNSLDFEVF